MSSSPLSRSQEKHYERAASQTAKCPSCRVYSTRRRLKLRIPEPIAHLMIDTGAVVTLIGSAIPIHNYNPSHCGGSDLTLPLKEGNSVGKETASIFPLYLRRVVNLAEVAVRDMLERNETLEKIMLRIASIHDTLHIKRLLEEPPPELFLAACLLFAFAIRALQHWHEADRYLNRILVSGLIIGCAVAFQTTNVLMELKSYLAWSAILALLFDLFVHWAMRLWRYHQIFNNASKRVFQLRDERCDRRDDREEIAKVLPQ